MGDLQLATVVLNVADMPRAVRFWTAVLGYRRREREGNEDFVMLEDPQGQRLPVSLQRSEDAHRQPVRVHLDLYTNEQDRQVRWLVGLGATAVTDWPYPPDADFVVLRDPDDNEFCVIGHAELT